MPMKEPSRKVLFLCQNEGVWYNHNDMFCVFGDEINDETIYDYRWK